MKRSSNLQDLGQKIKEAILGSDAEDQKYYLYFYVIGTIVFFGFLIVFSSLGSIASSVNNIKPAVKGMTIIGMYFFAMLLIRGALALTKSSREFYMGHNSKEIQADDFSEIEAMIARGEFIPAINAYRREFREREGKDERPRLRIAEIYRLELKDYKSSLNQYALIARTTQDADTQLTSYISLLELYREHFPQEESFPALCRKIMQEYPNTMAFRLAQDCLISMANSD